MATLRNLLTTESCGDFGLGHHSTVSAPPGPCQRPRPLPTSVVLGSLGLSASIHPRCYPCRRKRALRRQAKGATQHEFLRGHVAHSMGLDAVGGDRCPKSSRRPLQDVPLADSSVITRTIARRQRAATIHRTRFQSELTKRIHLESEYVFD